MRSFTRCLLPGLLTIALLLGVMGTPAAAAPRSGGSFVWIAPYGISIDTLDPAATVQDKATKMEMLRIANDLITQWAPLWFYNYNKAVIAFQPWVHGMEPVGVEMMYQHMDGVWVDETSPRANDK